LKYLRAVKGFNQSQMLDFIGIDGITKWSDYERGKARPPIEILVLISDKFQISLDDLIKKDLRSGCFGQKKCTEKINEKVNVHQRDGQNRSLTDDYKDGFKNSKKTEEKLINYITFLELRLKELESEVIQLQQALNEVCSTKE
jgi:transcriptional regulator with XRE-family HTH domain